MPEQLTPSPAAFAEFSPLRLEEPLARWTTLRVGGPAEWFFEPRRPEDLAALLTALHKAQIPFRLLGGGANVLAPDAGVRGAVIHTGALRRIFLEGTALRCWPGATIQQTVRAAAGNGLHGLELLMGVPGHIGGALAMNAGSADFGIWDVVEEVTVWEPEGPWKARARADFDPQYRNGNLGQAVSLEILLRLEKSTKVEVKITQEALLRKKNQTQPVTLFSAGCAFKNPLGESAGRLLDQAGMKGVSVGRASVSTLHANFVVTEPGATSADVLTLLEKMASAVLEYAGITLERELVVW